jgi:hypothetical protein
MAVLLLVLKMNAGGSLHKLCVASEFVFGDRQMTFFEGAPPLRKKRVGPGAGQSGRTIFSFLAVHTVGSLMPPDEEGLEEYRGESTTSASLGDASRIARKQNGPWFGRL